MFCAHPAGAEHRWASLFPYYTLCFGAVMDPGSGEEWRRAKKPTLDGSKESVNVTWCPFSSLKAALLCNVTQQPHTLPTALCTSYPPGPRDLHWIGKTLWYELWLGRGRRENGHPEWALVSLGVFSFLIKSVDVASHWFGKRGSDDFCAYHVPNTWKVASVYYVHILLWQISVGSPTLSRQLGRGAMLPNSMSLPSWAYIRIVSFTENYSSVLCYVGECTSFNGNDQSNWRSDVETRSFIGSKPKRKKERKTQTKDESSWSIWLSISGSFKSSCFEVLLRIDRFVF